MGEAVSIRAALERIGFTQPASSYIVVDQGFNEVADYTILTDEEAAKICYIT